MRAFAAADIRQHDKGTVALGAGATVTLPQGVLGGNNGIICMATAFLIDPPEQWDESVMVPTGQAAFDLAVLLRAQLPAEESSWPFTFPAGSAAWLWTVDELANAAWKGAEGASYVVDPAPAASTLSTGTASPVGGAF